VFTFHVDTPAQGFVDILPAVRNALRDSAIERGLCVVFTPHTTAGITINENADPDVQHDLLLALERAFPQRPEFRHDEGNSPAHVKSSVLGCSTTLIIENGAPVLGRWQTVYLCEFDGPRRRTVHLTIVPC
jgi:secondary thiamine-phosphate synthase enzyme